MAEWENVGKIQGEKGEQGVQGEQGEQGIKGEDGIDGVNGKDAVVETVENSHFKCTRLENGFITCVGQITADEFVDEQVEIGSVWRHQTGVDLPYTFHRATTHVSVSPLNSTKWGSGYINIADHSRATVIVYQGRAGSPSASSIIVSGYIGEE